MKKQFIVLDNVRSTHNVGAIFRTADAAGVAEIYLCGYTPAPIDRFGRPVEAMKKTALGAIDTVVWSSVLNVEVCIDVLQKNGVSIVAVEQSIRSHSLFSYQLPDSDVAYVFGNEIDGVTPAVLDKADQIIEIPMYGQKESLNVAVSAGIVLYTTHPNREQGR